MARWLLELEAAAARAQLGAGSFSPFVVLTAAGVFLGMCCALMVALGGCSFCDVYRKRVGDKASSSDGDTSPGGKQTFFLATKKFASAKFSGSSEQGKAEAENEQLRSGLASDHQQPGKMSPHVWQRAILMGERCQRPTFSGLVLYDEKGNPLPRRVPTS
ncbi:hypothetical protein KP509_07G007100 [Ceratopteris richardii]|uniref:Uncharacterized protein n=1 Tax=Ceratopteris richardii TaxID=49495 RepID=A0A8T2UI61_CERRI|nr:hypothetical protein KP509_07G007100 [Ceratopteris richardii]